MILYVLIFILACCVAGFALRKIIIIYKSSPTHTVLTSEGFVQMKVGERYETEDLQIEMVDIVSDSRCPTSVECFWPGNVIIQFNLLPIYPERVFKTHAVFLGNYVGYSMYMKPDYEMTKDSMATIKGLYSFQGYRIGVSEVTPYPQSPDNKIKKADYLVKLSVVKVANFKKSGFPFSFDYPLYNGWKTTPMPDKNTIQYQKENSDIAIDISWQEISLKVTPDFWNAQKINPKGIRYYSDKNEVTGKKTVVFNLPADSIEFTFNEIVSNDIETLLIDSIEDNYLPVLI